MVSTSFFVFTSCLLQLFISINFININEGKFRSIFNGKNFNGWHIVIDGYDSTNLSTNIFRIIPKGVLHISGQKFGYLSTNKEYTNFHLKLEFKWGEKKWEPKLNEPRDSGILYGVIDERNVVSNSVWPRSIECQIQEGDTGDFWLVNESSIEVDGARTNPGRFVRAKKRVNAENPVGTWNTVEVIFMNGHCKHIVNGVLVNEGYNASENSGKILIQSEGAEVFYRNIQIKNL